MLKYSLRILTPLTKWWQFWKTRLPDHCRYLKCIYVVFVCKLHANIFLNDKELICSIDNYSSYPEALADGNRKDYLQVHVKAIVLCMWEMSDGW